LTNRQSRYNDAPLDHSSTQRPKETQMSRLSENPEQVKFLYWDNLTYSPPASRRPEDWDPAAATALYSAYLEHCVEAERLGYAGVSLPEHTTPCSISPAPNVLLAALAVRTKSVRIVSGVNIPLWWRPVDLATEWAMIDVLSGGRLEVGLGRHGDPGAQERAIDLIDNALHRIDYPMPVEDAPGAFASHKEPKSIIKNTLWPRPAQERLPLWLAGGSRELVESAAKRGFGLMTGLSTNPQAGGLVTGTLEKVIEGCKFYIEKGRDAGHNLSMGNVAVICFTTVADTDEEAGELARSGFINHVKGAYEAFTRAGAGILEAKLPPGGVESLFERPADSYLQSTFSLVGSVETVRKKLETLMSAGLRRFILSCGMGQPHERSWQTASDFAQKVAPDLFGTAAGSALPFPARTASTPAGRA
jgi:alkanesulfonate monooxygenase SsuD/methylene tetrahydromethanopterin reductase-like flavin-dependent oxidoreductase (luciferase family)